MVSRSKTDGQLRKKSKKRSKKMLTSEIKRVIIKTVKEGTQKGGK
jgi:protein required for attachment to host cells